MKKEDKKEIVKKYYDVKLECMLPAIITYRILAESPEQAFELIKSRQPNSVNYRLIGKRDIKAVVYEACCTMIKFVKNF